MGLRARPGHARPRGLSSQAGQVGGAERRQKDGIPAGAQQSGMPKLDASLALLPWPLGVAAPSAPLGHRSSVSAILNYAHAGLQFMKVAKTRGTQ